MTRVSTAARPQTRQQRADIIADMARQGYSSHQMPAKVGVTEESVRQIARDFDIEIPADKAIKGTRRIDSTDVVRRTVLGLEVTTSSLETAISWRSVHPPPDELDSWIQTLRSAETDLRYFRQRLEALQDGIERTCPVCSTAVTGRSDRVYCGATCRQRARRKFASAQGSP